MMKKLFQKEKTVHLVLNRDQINCIIPILDKELKRLAPIQQLNNNDSVAFVNANRYCRILKGKTVVVLPFTKEERGELLWLMVLLMCEADKVEDKQTKDNLNSIAARIQCVHRKLGV